MGVAVDHSLDSGVNNRALAHELVHQMSRNENVDAGDAEAGNQGANDPGNIMNGGSLGDDLTEKQCELIEKHLP